jgi:hypothetical protein
MNFCPPADKEDLIEKYGSFSYLWEDEQKRIYDFVSTAGNGEISGRIGFSDLFIENFSMNGINFSSLPNNHAYYINNVPAKLRPVIAYSNFNPCGHVFYLDFDSPGVCGFLSGVRHWSNKVVRFLWRNACGTNVTSVTDLIYNFFYGIVKVLESLV